MMLTVEQRAILRADIFASTDPEIVTARGGGVIGLDATTLTAIYNRPSTFIVYRTATLVSDIFDAIVWANMTPASAPDGSTLWTNRNLQCQSKQLALQTILVGRETINTSKANVRAGLQDALTQLPSKADGTTQPAGWVAVLAALKRPATRLEALFATGTGTDAAPGAMVVEGALDVSEMGQACNGE